MRDVTGRRSSLAITSRCCIEVLIDLRDISRLDGVDIATTIQIGAKHNGTAIGNFSHPQ